MTRIILPVLCISTFFLTSFFACQKTSNVIIEDYADTSDQIQLDIAMPTGQIIPASLDKPEGKDMDVVLLLPEEENYQLEDQITEIYFERGYMVLRLDHDAFFGLGEGKQATLAAIDFVKKDLGKYNIELGKLIVHGNFKSASHAFLTALETKVDAVILSEPTADNDIWRAALVENKLAHLKSSFLLISAEEKSDRIKENLLDLEKSYHNCKTCKQGSQFVYHPGTPEEWNQDAIWELIFEFVES